MYRERFSMKFLRAHLFRKKKETVSSRGVYDVKELRENLVKCVEESGRFDTCLFIGMKIHYARSRFAYIDSSLCNVLA